MLQPQVLIGIGRSDAVQTLVNFSLDLLKLICRCHSLRRVNGLSFTEGNFDGLKNKILIIVSKLVTVVTKYLVVAASNSTTVGIIASVFGSAHHVLDNKDHVGFAETVQPSFTV